MPNTPVVELEDLPKGIRKLLAATEFKTLGTLATATRSQLLAVRGIGEGSIMDIRAVLDNREIPHDLYSKP
jgi:hypothetical protein